MKLLKSNIEYDDGWITRYNTDGSIAARHAVTDVREVSVHKQFDPPALITAVAFVAGACVSYVFITTEWVRWTAVIVLAFIGVVSLVDPFERVLTLQLRHGKVSYTLKDDAELCNGFMLSIGSDISGAPKEERMWS